MPHLKSGACLILKEAHATWYCSRSGFPHFLVKAAFTAFLRKKRHLPHFVRITKTSAESGRYFGKLPHFSKSIPVFAEEMTILIYLKVSKNPAKTRGREDHF